MERRAPSLPVVGALPGGFARSRLILGGLADPAAGITAAREVSILHYARRVPDFIWIQKPVREEHICPN